MVKAYEGNNKNNNSMFIVECDGSTQQNCIMMYIKQLQDTYMLAKVFDGRLSL